MIQLCSEKEGYLILVTSNRQATTIFIYWIYEFFNL